MMKWLSVFALCSLACAAAAEIRWDENILRREARWYSSPEARAIANSVIQHQSVEGGWPKDTNLAAVPRSPEATDRGKANTIDNNATTMPMEFLAKVAHATGDERYREAFIRGVDYVLAAQYPNGGWPQFFPLRKGYYSHITFNDGAMIHVLTVLRDVAGGRPPYDFDDAERRAKGAAAVERGIDVVLRSQVRQNGK
ncbi:MAG: pectate lyase, partial [Thermoanaerobaculia bacterium]